MTLVDFLLQNAGAIIMVLGFAGSAIGGAYLLRNDVRNLTFRMEAMEKEFKAFREVMIVIARQDERMNSIEKRTDERFQNMRRDIELLRKGESFILPIHRGAYEHGGEDH